jgi:hypothetical protein
MMNGSSPNIESRIGDIERAVHVLEARLDAYEQRAAVAGTPPAASIPSDQLAPGNESDLDAVLVLTFVGRTLVALGGAYLLRALTEARVLPTAVGLAVGFAYAAAWLAAADRSAAAGRALSATFLGATMTIIALPLVFEAATRFAIVDGLSGAAMLTVISLAVLGVAVHRRLHALAWIIVCGAVAASLATTAASGFVLPFTVVDIAVGLLTLWIGYTVDWVWLRWLPAFVADLAVLALAFAASSRSIAAPPWQIVSIQMMLFAGYLSSIGVRTLVRGREINFFEISQGLLALAAGFGGALYVAQATGAGASLVTAVGLLCAAAAYGVAFAFVARRQGLHRNFYFYTSIALVLVLASTATWHESGALVWAALAVLTSWAVRRTGHFALSLHGAIYIGAAAIGSGLVATWAVSVGASPAASAFQPTMAVVVAAACACWAAPSADSTRPLIRLPRLAIALLLAWSAVAAIVAIAFTVTSDPGAIATVRTAALVAAIVAAAAIGRYPSFVEAGWLVYPLLVAGAVKLVADDLRHSRPATLFVALGVYGAALIAAPRIAQRGSKLASGRLSAAVLSSGKTAVDNERIDRQDISGTPVR